MKRYSNRSGGATRGFTLIELLVVVAIIGMLTSAVMIGLNQARAKGRDVARRTQLRALQEALELYHTNRATYPLATSWLSSQPGDIATYSADYIPGIVAMGEIQALPRDPRGGDSTILPPCSGWKSAYLYLSDGKEYKLLSNCAPEASWDSSDPFYDPVRPTWAWMVCSGPPACETW